MAGLALWQIATRHLGLSRVLSFALVLLLWTGPSALLYTSFYRAAKAGLLCATLLAAWAWCAARARGGWRTGLFALLAAALPMWDKQGLLFLGALVLWLARDAWLDRTPRTRALLAAGRGALVFAWCYQRFLGPALTRHLLGYEVNRGYVSIPWGALATQPRYAATVLLGAPLLAFDSFRFPAGSLPAGLALLALWWLWRQFPADARPAALRPGTAFLALGVFIAAVYAAMLLLFPLLFSSEHRRFFYGEPVTALWLLAIATSLAAALRRTPERARWIELAVAALVVGNLFAAQEHRFVLRHGKYAPFVENATRVRAALRPAALAAAGLTRADAAARLDLAPYVRDAVVPELIEDRIYLTLSTRAALSH